MNQNVDLLVILILATLFEESLGATDFTDPPSGSVISNFEGTQNATTITCNVSRTDTGTQVTTQWNVGNFRGGGPDSLQPATVAPELFSVGGDPIPNVNFLFDNKLIILNWAAELDGVIVYCGTGQDPQQASFTLRIYRPPNLRDNLLVMIEENELDAPIDLRRTPVAFPEPTMFTWYKDGQPLTRFEQTFSGVTIASVQRSDTGNYSVIATNFVSDGSMEQVGSDAGSFYLDVLYGPSFRFDGPQQIPTQVYALLGSPLSLVCGRGLVSNPEAVVTWIAPDGSTIMDNARYDLEDGPEVVRLNFTHGQPILNDSGVWICDVVVRSERHVISNQRQLILGGQAVIGTPLRHRFMLTVIVAPGQPRALSVQNIGATWVRIHWEPPTEVNIPISYYEIIASAAGSGFRLSTPDNNTFINVTSLNPGTTYNFSVLAVIQAGEVVARSEGSAPLEDIVTTTVANLGPLSCLSCHVTVVGGVLGSLLVISLLINVIVVPLLLAILIKAKLLKSVTANDATYEYPEIMSPKSEDPKMESCAAYGVVNTEHL